MAYAHTVGGTRYVFPDLRTLLARANEGWVIRIDLVEPALHLAVRNRVGIGSPIHHARAARRLLAEAIDGVA